MTFIERIDSLSTRFLTERSYELIVGPAIADLQHDADSTPEHSLRGRLSVLAAFAGAVYDEITADSSLFMIVLILPEAGAFVTARASLMVLAVGIAVMSFGPVLVCCWPERTPRRPDVADA